MMIHRNSKNYNHNNEQKRFKLHTKAKRVAEKRSARPIQLKSTQRFNA